MTITEKAHLSVLEAAALLREKSPESMLVERNLLLRDAWERVRELPQALQLGRGLCYILQHASLPTKPHDLLLGRFDDHVPTEKELEELAPFLAAKPHRSPIVSHNGGHITPELSDAVTLGLPALLARATQRLQAAKQNGEREEAIHFLTGMCLVWEGILAYVGRYADAAEAAGLTDAAAIARRLCEGAPQHVADALQLLLFLYNIYLIYAGTRVACLNLGRLDEMLLPLYQSDLSLGIGEEEIGAYIDDFSAKLSLHLGRGEHQMAKLDPDHAHTGWLRNHVYDSPAYITLGGTRNGTAEPNPLSLLFAKHIHPSLKNPVYVCRYHENAPTELWDILCRRISENASLLLYNDGSVIPAFLRAGIERDYAVNYSVHPCNWADIPTSAGVLAHAGEPLPILIERALQAPEGIDSMDALYARIEREFLAICRPVLEIYRKKRRDGERAPDGVLSLDDCLLRGPLEAARGVRHGGAKYPYLYLYLRAIGTAADMLAAIDTLVFRERVCTLPQLCAAAKKDFAGEELLLARCRKAPKYGQDDDRADAHATALMTRLLDAFERECFNAEGERDVYAMCITVNDSNHLYDGQKTGATVDGRRAGAPFSENLSGTVGTSKGVTPLLRSAAKLPFDRIHSGVLNVKLDRASGKGEAGAAYIRSLIEGYFADGGMQLQFSITDASELRAAQKDPDAHRDLLVRVTGYSAVFVDVCKAGQEELIRREEL